MVKTTGQFAPDVRQRTRPSVLVHEVRHAVRWAAKMYLNEMFQGRGRPAPPVTEFPNLTSLNKSMMVGPITRLGSGLTAP